MSELFNIKVLDRKGNETTLEEHKGKVLLIVNTATGCGLTPQYKALEAMYEKYHDQGFEILDFPCNQFLGQAPGTDDQIHDFCTIQYHTTFPRYKKVKVNGKEACELFVWLKEQKKGRIKWNFTKFLINREGEVVARFEPMEKPESFENEVAKLLK